MLKVEIIFFVSTNIQHSEFNIHKLKVSFKASELQSFKYSHCFNFQVGIFLSPANF